MRVKTCLSTTPLFSANSARRRLRICEPVWSQIIKQAKARIPDFSLSKKLSLREMLPFAVIHCRVFALTEAIFLCKRMPVQARELARKVYSHMEEADWIEDDTKRLKMLLRVLDTWDREHEGQA